MCTPQGSIFNVTLPIIKKRKKVEYSIFASYSLDDSVKVKLLIDLLERVGCRMNDPERDSIPGKYLLQNLIENGIDKTEMAILFVSKNFNDDKWCECQANHVISKHVSTEGKYRVIPVLLESCKLPYYLKSSNCISLWKYIRSFIMDPENATTHMSEAISRLVKAIVSPSRPFWRIRLQGNKAVTHGNRIIRNVRYFGRKTLMKGRRIVRGMKEYIQREEAKKTVSGHVQVNPLYLLKIARLLEHCLISCRYGRCSFQTSGLEFNRFQEHLNQCKFIEIKCKHKGCIVAAKRYQIQKHEEKCPFMPVKCRYDGCSKMEPLCLQDEHMIVCKHRPEPCPFVGCLSTPKLKDLKSHILQCEFRPVSCPGCKQIFKLNEAQLHECIRGKCGLPPEEVLQRELHRISRQNSGNKRLKHKCSNIDCGELFENEFELQSHQITCKFKILTCPNTFCDYENTKAKLDQHMLSGCEYRSVKCDKCRRIVSFKDLQKHKGECSSTKTKCENCGIEIKRSSKRDHDLRFCTRRKPLSRCQSSPSSYEYPNRRGGGGVEDNSTAEQCRDRLRGNADLVEPCPRSPEMKGLLEVTKAIGLNKETLYSRKISSDNNSITEEEEEGINERTQTSNIIAGDVGGTRGTRKQSDEFVENVLGASPKTKLGQRSSSAGEYSSTHRHIRRGKGVPESLDFWRKILEMIEKRDDIKQYFRNFQNEA